MATINPEGIQHDLHLLEPAAKERLYALLRRLADNPYHPDVLNEAEQDAAEHYVSWFDDEWALIWKPVYRSEMIYVTTLPEDLVVLALYLRRIPPTKRVEGRPHR